MWKWKHFLHHQATETIGRHVFRKIMQDVWKLDENAQTHKIILCNCSTLQTFKQLHAVLKSDYLTVQPLTKFLTRSSLWCDEVY